MHTAAADTSAAGQKMIPADCVSVLLMSLGNTSLTKAQYDMMSALDGSRTASSFQHQFRSITAKAKELKTRAENGEQFVAVQPTKKRSAAAVDDVTPPATPKKQKASAKPKATLKPCGKKTKAKGGDSNGSSGPPSNEFAKNDDFANGFNSIIKYGNERDEI